MLDLGFAVIALRCNEVNVPVTFGKLCKRSDIEGRLIQSKKRIVFTSNDTFLALVVPNGWKSQSKKFLEELEVLTLKSVEEA